MINKLLLLSDNYYIVLPLLLLFDSKVDVLLHYFQLETTLNSLKSNPLIVGIRHILDFEEETWLSRDDVIRGLKVVEKFGLTFDLLLRYTCIFLFIILKINC